MFAPEPTSRKCGEKWGQPFSTGASCLVVVVVVMIGMSVAPVPVFRLLVLVRLRVFVSIPVVFCEVLVPGAILVVVPVVIILVMTIVDADLNAGLLRRGRSHDREWRGHGCGEEKRCEVMMWSVHVVSKIRMSRGGNAAAMSVRGERRGLMSLIAHAEG